MGRGLQESLESLRSKAETNPVACVMFSGGKDSMVCLDLVSRIFPKFFCVMMELDTDLEFNDKYVDFVKQRYGCEVKRVKHWTFYQYMRLGIYTWEVQSAYRIPDIKIKHIYAMIRKDFGDPVIVSGSKLKDGFGGGKKFSILKGKDGVVYPLKSWNKYDVLAYCKFHNLPVQKVGDKLKTSNGISLDKDCINWMYKEFPNDYNKLKKSFPFIEAEIKRSEFYGTK